MHEILMIEIIYCSTHYSIVLLTDLTFEALFTVLNDEGLL